MEELNLLINSENVIAAGGDAVPQIGEEAECVNPVGNHLHDDCHDDEHLAKPRVVEDGVNETEDHGDEEHERDYPPASLSHHVDLIVHAHVNDGADQGENIPHCVEQREARRVSLLD